MKNAAEDTILLKLYKFVHRIRRRVEVRHFQISQLHKLRAVGERTHLARALFRTGAHCVTNVTFESVQNLQGLLSRLHTQHCGPY
jgi:hypothetical protein